MVENQLWNTSQPVWMKRKVHWENKWMVPPLNVCYLIFPHLTPSCQWNSRDSKYLKYERLWQIKEGQLTIKNINFDENLTRSYSQFRCRLLLFFKFSMLECSNFSLITMSIDCLLIWECGNDVTIRGSQAREK